MDHPSHRRWRWPPRPVLLSTVLLTAVAATLALVPEPGRTSAQAAVQRLSGGLRQTLWMWPLAAALTLLALASPVARQRWNRPVQRIPPAIGYFVVLVTLSSQPRLDVVVGGLVAVGLLALWVLVVPRRLLRPVPAEVLERLSARERLEVEDRRVKLQNEMRTTALQAIAGLAVLAGAVLGFQQLTEDRQQSNATLALTLEGQASERFTRAIDQLGSDRLEVRIGGIYGLEQIARQAPDNRLAATEVLVAYLHRRIPRPSKPHSESAGAFVRPLSVRAPDAQAALKGSGAARPFPQTLLWTFMGSISSAPASAAVTCTA